MNKFIVVEILTNNSTGKGNNNSPFISPIQETDETISCTGCNHDKMFMKPTGINNKVSKDSFYIQQYLEIPVYARTLVLWKDLKQPRIKKG